MINGGQGRERDPVISVPDPCSANDEKQAKMGLAEDCRGGLGRCQAGLRYTNCRSRCIMRAWLVIVFLGMIASARAADSHSRTAVVTRRGLSDCEAPEPQSPASRCPGPMRPGEKDRRLGLPDGPGSRRLRLPPSSRPATRGGTIARAKTRRRPNCSHAPTTASARNTRSRIPSLGR